MTVTNIRARGLHREDAEAGEGKVIIENDNGTIVAAGKMIGAGADADEARATTMTTRERLQSKAMEEHIHSL